MPAAKLNQTANGFVISGALTFESVPAIFQTSLALFASVNEINIDLSQVTHSNSAALALLLEWQRYAGKNVKKICFTNLPQQLKQIATACDVIDILKLVA